MTERDIVTEVLHGLREIREHRAGTLTLRTVRVEPRPRLINGCGGLTDARLRQWAHVEQDP